MTQAFFLNKNTSRDVIVYSTLFLLSTVLLAYDTHIHHSKTRWHAYKSIPVAPFSNCTALFPQF